MHDLRALREQVDFLRDGMRRRGMDGVVGPFIDRGEQLERDRRAHIQATDERKAQRNANAQEVARRKRAGEGADELIAQGRALGDEIGQLERELAEIEGELYRVLLEIPNVTLPAVPAGGEEANIVVRQGEPVKSVREFIGEREDVHALVLGAAASGHPGLLVDNFTDGDAGKLPCPVMIIPGSLSDERLEQLS